MTQTLSLDNPPEYNYPDMPLLYGPVAGLSAYLSIVNTNFLMFDIKKLVNFIVLHLFLVEFIRGGLHISSKKMTIILIKHRIILWVKFLGKSFIISSDIIIP